MIIDYFRIAIQNITHRRLRSWLTMLGIFIGITAVVSLIGLGEGLKITIISQFGFIGADSITVQTGGSLGTGAVNPLTIDEVKLLEKMPNTEIVISTLISSVQVRFNKKQIFSFVGSMPDGRERKKNEEISGYKAESGRLLKDEDINKVVVGNKFASESTFGKEIVPGNRISINEKDFEVVGILKKTGSFINDYLILMNEQNLRNLINDKETVSTIRVFAKKNIPLEQLKLEIESELRKFRDVEEGKEDFAVELSANALDTLNSTLFAIQLFVYIIAGISIIVGGIGITNTMYTAVLERTKEIGIMKSIGAGTKDIFFIFLIESGFLGMVGGLIGVIFGTLLANGMAFLGGQALGSNIISANISVYLIVGSLLFSFIIGTLAGTIPARKASRLIPVDALRS